MYGAPGGGQWDCGDFGTAATHTFNPVLFSFFFGLLCGVAVQDF